MNTLINKQAELYTQKQSMQKRSMQKNRGFTLLEALIGFLILSIGMLGIASLQAVSLKAGKTSVYTSVALMKVDEIFESMRVNSSIDALTAYEAAGMDDGAGADNSCSSVNCSEILLAQDDIYWWKQNLKAGLPDAATTDVTLDAPVVPSKMAVVTIEIAWQERDKDSAGSKDKSYTTVATICTENPC